eukprot:1516834-Rhodomonas_salina.6
MCVADLPDAEHRSAPRSSESLRPRFSPAPVRLCSRMPCVQVWRRATVKPLTAACAARSLRDKRVLIFVAGQTQQVLLRHEAPGSGLAHAAIRLRKAQC